MKDLKRKSSAKSEAPKNQDAKHDVGRRGDFTSKSGRQNAKAPNLGTSEKSRTPRVIEETKSVYSALVQPKNRKFLILSLIIHLLVAGAFLINWSSFNNEKKYEIPKSITVRAATQSELDALRQVKEKAIKKEAERLAKLEERKKREQLRKIEKQKKEAQRKKAAEEARKKKALAEKKARELKRQKAELAKQKKLEAEKIEKQRLQKIEEDRLAELARQEEIKRLKEKEIEEQEALERKLAERLAQLQEQKAEQNRIALEAAEAAKLERELSEVEYYIGVIRTRIESRWRVPPRTKGLKVALTIKLLPSGELVDVSLHSSSGSTAFDNSAIHAVKSVGQFPAIKDNAIFEKHFRSFLMSFSSPDDGL